MADSRRRDMTRRYSLAIVSGHPTQWEGPLFAKLARHPLIDLIVYYWSDLGLGCVREKDSGVVLQWDIPILEGYQFRLLGQSLRGIALLVREILSSKYDAVVVEGHRGSVFLAAIVAAVLSGTPLFYRSDSTLLYGRSAAKRLLSRWLLPFLYRLMKGFLPLSSLAADFLKAYGVPSERIFLAPYTVDNEYISRLCEEYRLRREEVRQRWGIDAKAFVALAILRFEERERPLDFLRAAALLNRKGLQCKFVLVGDGPQRPLVEDFISKQDLDVILPGFRPYSELPMFYSIADVFVHPAARECWGLSVNEAMVCGLPVIVSDQVGAGYDLVRHGENGFVFPVGEVEILAKYIEELATNRELCARLGAQARRTMESHSYDQCVSSFVQALSLLKR